MVFYYISANIKLLRNIWLDYEDAEETSPYEYIKSYIEKCPSCVDDQKLVWIAETFLGHKKHFEFLREIASAATSAEELSEIDQDYFIITLYAITFDLEPKDMELLYKSMFNLSKPLLMSFTKFLSNNEMLTYISQVAQFYYDACYVNEKIISPLFIWQPYISEMGHNYAEHVKKLENRRVKPLTVPVQPTVLCRKGKEATKSPSQPSIPTTPPNSIHNRNRKMLTKSVIDKRLQIIHEKNKQNAANLLNNVKNDKNFSYARPAQANKTKRISYDESPQTYEQSFHKPKRISSKPSIPVRENIATVKRFNMRVQMTEQEELQWIHDMLSCFRNTAKIEKLIETEREEKEKDRLYDIEKKHLMGQISHEEAFLAKRKVEKENKKKYDEFMKEKDKWDKAVNEWKKEQLQKNLQRIENVSLIELKTLEAKNGVIEKKKENAEKVKKESETIKAEIMKKKEEQLEERVKMIKEIKILSMIARKSNVPKVIDLTETSGLGLLCEMSMAELEERLAALKIGIKEEVERRKAIIKKGNELAKKELEETKKYVKSFIKERADMRQKEKTIRKSVKLDKKSSQEINALKKTLEEKRKLRAKT